MHAVFEGRARHEDDDEEGMGAEQKRMEATQGCTILRHKKSMLGFEMTKCSK